MFNLLIVLRVVTSVVLAMPLCVAREPNRVTLVAIPHLAIERDHHPSTHLLRRQIPAAQIFRAAVTSLGGEAHWLQIWTIQRDVAAVAEWAGRTPRPTSVRMPAQIIDRAFATPGGWGSPYDFLSRLKTLSITASAFEKEHVRGWFRRMREIERQLDPEQRAWFEVDFHQPILDLRRMYACASDLET